MSVKGMHFNYTFSKHVNFCFAKCSDYVHHVLVQTYRHNSQLDKIEGPANKNYTLGRSI